MHIHPAIALLLGATTLLTIVSCSDQIKFCGEYDFKGDCVDLAISDAGDCQKIPDFNAKGHLGSSFGVSGFLV